MNCVMYLSTIAMPIPVPMAVLVIVLWDRTDVIVQRVSEGAGVKWISMIVILTLVIIMAHVLTR